MNGLGIAGVAPGVSLVNLRAGQDSGFFFLQPTVDALTYAAPARDRRGEHVLLHRPLAVQLPREPGRLAGRAASSRPRSSTRRSARVDYARAHGVTLIAALGNENTDLGNPTFDDTSPDYPPGTEHDARRSTTPASTCRPSREGVVGVSALGPSTRKAYYSNYGTEQTDVSAPGGDSRDFFGTDRFNSPQNRVLSTYPLSALQAEGDGRPGRERDLAARREGLQRQRRAATTGTCRGPRWRRRTPRAWRR